MNSVLKFVFFFAILTVVSAAVKKSYDGYTLYKIVPKDKSDVKILEEIRANNVGEFWDESFRANQEAKVMVSPEKREEFVRHLADAKIETKIIINNIQRAIDDQLNPASIRSSESYLSYNWSEYHNLENIYSWLDELAETHPLVVRTVVMGQSVEGRDIKGIIINYQPTNMMPLMGVLEGTLHAREWISAATVTWIIKEFLTSNNPEIRALAEGFEWHIFPVVNPDGYSYTFTHNRMWRKNRSPDSVKTCSENVDDDMSHGVDLNRNFDYEWMTIGASNDSCVNTYAGPQAFSEPESRAIAQYVQEINEKGRVIYYIAFHSYTQLIIIPYSHIENNEDSLLAGNYPDMYEIAIRGADVLAERYGTNYRVGLSVNVLYPMSGASFDWVKYAVRVPITYLIELRDLGEYGFLLPPDQIIPTGLETVDALVEMGKQATRLGYTSPLLIMSAAHNMFFSVTILLLSILVSLFM